MGRSKYCKDFAVEVFDGSKKWQEGTWWRGPCAQGQPTPLLSIQWQSGFLRHYIVFNVVGFLDVTPGGVTSKNPTTLNTI